MAEKQENAVGNNTDILKRIEKNRQRALALRESRLASNGIASIAEKRQKLPQIISSDGGFMVEFDDDWDVEESSISQQTDVNYNTSGTRCELCGNIFYESFLLKYFSENICSTCRDSKGKHKLIARTDAKETYLLKDADLDKREPPLPFIERRNPHRPGGSMMKLYLEQQVAKRAEELWGSLDKIEEEHDIRSEKREKIKKKRFDKKVKELRKTVYGNSQKKPTMHVHEFGEETHDSQADMYSKVCRTCGYVSSYERM